MMRGKKKFNFKNEVTIEKEKLFVLSRWKLTLGYNIILFGKINK